MRFYCDKELKDAHGAEADTLATVEVFAGQLERYADLDLSVDALHEVSNAVNNGFVDLSRRFSWRDNEPVFNFGKLKGKSLRWAASEPTERTYLRGILDGHFEEDTKLLVREALAGKIRQRVRAQHREEAWPQRSTPPTAPTTPRPRRRAQVWRSPKRGLAPLEEAQRRRVEQRSDRRVPCPAARCASATRCRRSSSRGR
jgi:hypothetical protein